MFRKGGHSELINLLNGLVCPIIRLTPPSTCVLSEGLEDPEVLAVAKKLMD